ncbi:hypothetical protein I601_3908 [Nocardioides dokdonensis FR1436]|uniref:Uncharacterized protein n=1 Tax=Nocardioides dokdonensis FR1436 TaxID=1300347 RepID=A0A1A9GQG4_9ACTN|nr:hypothetical protein [Nocardioides dokdonensis]ANH40306.1 hypothetical protein I601_3908 [Nocardioides dokdonensis FR1436]
MQNNLGRLGGQLGVLLCLLGFLVIFFGWNGAASTDYVPAQFPFLISGGIVGTAVVIIGAAMILVQNFRTDMARLEAAVERVALAIERQGADAGAVGAGIDSYVVAGSESYHRVECSLPEARAEAHLVPLTDVAGSPLQPCRVCLPPTFGRLATH